MHRAAVPARARRGLLRPLPAMDLPFLILVLTLVGFGLVMLYSASSAVALYRRGDAWAYVRPQLLYAAMGIGAMWAASSSLTAGISRGLARRVQQLLLAASNTPSAL